MKLCLRLVSVCACALSMNAQIIATLNRLSNGLDEVRIRNNSSANLVAFAATANQTPLSPHSSTAPVIVFSDVLIDSKVKPLAPGEERVAMIRGMGYSQPGGQESAGKRALQEPVFVAGIMADGSTTGDPTLLTRLIVRRANLLVA